MKTIEDLKKIIPTITELFAAAKHDIGDGTYEENLFTYDEDGWYIEISYQCCGKWDSFSGDYWNPSYHDLEKAWGELTEITASHYDFDTDEETIFSEEDLDELYSRIYDILENLA